MRRSSTLIAFVFLGLLIISSCKHSSEREICIVPSSDNSFPSRLATKEIRRYFYLRTGQLPEVIDTAGSVEGATQILLTIQGLDSNESLPSPELWKPWDPDLETQQYQIQTLATNGTHFVAIRGGDPIGLLYGAYRFAEHIGIRFYLHGDVVPENMKTGIDIRELNETGKPLFELRGIQPFHDFPEGPDWWDENGYKAVLSQLPKLRMNFFGLHTYPEGGVGPEPAVWIGSESDVNQDGSVKFAYPSRHFTTGNVTGSWGYQPKKTSEYSFGAASIFEKDIYGPDYMSGTHPWTEMSDIESAGLFDRFGALLDRTFSFAGKLGIKTAIGTETPLVIPKTVRQRLDSQGKRPSPNNSVKELYKGIFTRIVRTHPLDYYWFWTPEDWTWEGASEEEIKNTITDLQAAISAVEELGDPFTLATCGWVLGPQQDRTLFDTALPKEMPISCINRNVGHDYVEPGFATVKERPKWAIPWLEDDPAMIIPQLWVGRMRKDAVDALNHGCTGLMGIHWRTRILGPNVSALARAAWDQKGLRRDDAMGGGSDNWLSLSDDDRRQSYPVERYLPQDDFYADWSSHQFGETVAKDVADLFTRLDCHLPRPSTWVDGPGGIRPDSRKWEDVAPAYSFVAELEAIRPLVIGQGNLERFDYWLNSFRYLKAVGKLNCTWAEYNQAIEDVRNLNDPVQRRRQAEDLVLPIRKELVTQVDLIHRFLLETVSTPGGFGNVANWQQHILPMLLEQPGKELAEILGRDLPEETMSSAMYSGKARLFVPVARTLLDKGESYTAKVVCIGFEPAEISFHWRLLGEEGFKTLQVRHIARGVYRIELDSTLIEEDFEYYVKALNPKGPDHLWPPTAPELNQTVVVIR